jgi:outer membrane protein OmpA-like peptidoglycan-associated protein
MDLYKTTMDEFGEWSKPINISDSINTEGAESSPFIHPDNKTLYFSSDGHIGMGGMDIFYCRKDSNDNWGKPVNIGYPINTFGDENSLILNARGDMAYFASDKLEGFGQQDLYKFKLYEEARPNPVSYMKGIVYDDQTKKRLEAKFELISLKDGQTKVESKSDPVNGEFLVCLPTGSQYALNVSKKGYLFYSENFSTPAEIHHKIDPFLKNVPLKPIKVGESVVLKNIFFEFDKYNLKKESRVELNKLYNLLKENKSLKIEIGGHTDNKGSEEYNKTLSQNRAKAVYEYLTSKGISSERLSYKGYGESKPIDTNKTEEGRANNRRTEFKVIDN